MAQRTDGVWVARDTTGEQVRPFAEEIDALRFANGEGYYLKVVFVPYGEDACRYTPVGDGPAESAPAG